MPSETDKKKDPDGNPVIAECRGIKTSKSGGNLFVAHFDISKKISSAENLTVSNGKLVRGIKEVVEFFITQNEPQRVAFEAVQHADGDEVSTIIEGKMETLVPEVRIRRIDGTSVSLQPATAGIADEIRQEITAIANPELEKVLNTLPTPSVELIGNGKKSTEIISYEEYKNQFRGKRKKTERRDETIDPDDERAAEMVGNVTNNRPPKPAPKPPEPKAKRKKEAPLKYTCEDALRIPASRIKGEGVTGDLDSPHDNIKLHDKTMDNAGVAPTYKKELQAIFNGKYEAWILTPAKDTQTPHFFVIKRSSNGSIDHAARYDMQMNPMTGLVEIDQHHYDSKTGKSMSHPAHPLPLNSDPTERNRSIQIAEAVKEDAYSHWHARYWDMSSELYSPESASAHDAIMNPAGRATPKITKAELVGTIQAPPTHQKSA